jgi:penicillin-binding protein 2
MSQEFFEPGTSFKGRVYILIALVLLTLGGYLVYLFDMQIVNEFEYKRRARQVSRRMFPITAQRGEIFDRNFDTPLVSNVDSFAVEVVPAEIKREAMNDLFQRLSEVLGMTKEDIAAKVPPEYYHLYQPIEIKNGVSFETITYISEHNEEFSGVTWHNKPIRNYIDVSSLSHILGYVGGITRDEFQVLYNKGYSLNSTLGKAGIEKVYDMTLRGADGMTYKTVDVSGRSMEDSSIEDIPHENGKNIVLTVDRKIQKLCEDALGERIGAAVVLKPATGEILAMVSYPWYDPNIFFSPDSKEAYRALSLDSRNPFLNRAVQSNYAPASTFKTVLTTAIIEESLFPPTEKIYCEGSFRLGDRVFRCHQRQGHGALNLPQALAESCDVYYYTVGLKNIGIDIIAEYARKYGFGELTGIDLPGEITGLVPTPKWKERMYNSKWVGGDTVNVSIGQGYLLATPIQMANMMAMIANRGLVYKPHLVKEVRDPISGELLEEIKPEELRHSSIRKETFDTVASYMRGVITDGTAKVALTTKAVDVAGKTGTGEVGREDSWTAWFAAYGPYNAKNPEDQVVVVTMVEASDNWEWWAIRAANIIFQGIFANQSYDEAIDALRWGWLRNDPGVSNE